MTFKDHFSPVEIAPPELLLKACSDGQRLGLQLVAVAGLQRPLADYGGWWCSARRMWLLSASTPERALEVLQHAYSGQFVYLEEADVTLRAAMAAPQADYFTELLDVQVFPLAKGDLSRGMWAVSFQYDPLCVQAMRSLGGYFHKHAAAWQVRAEPNVIGQRLASIAGVKPEFIFVHEQPVILEELSDSSSQGSPIVVPAAPPPQGAGAGAKEEEGSGFFSTERDHDDGLQVDQALLDGMQAQGLLRDYQAQGVAFMVSQTGACMGDDMGLGKSRQTVVASRMAAGKERVLIACPAS